MHSAGNFLINPERLKAWWRENRTQMRQAIQTAVAACLAYAVAELLGVPQGFWAVVTAIMVMQANVGASLGQARDRFLGSLLGVLVGGGIAVLLADVHLLKYAGLGAAVLILAFFSAKRGPLRIACVTAAIIILGDPRLGPPISTAGYRMIEVMIGTVVAILTSLVIYPSRAGPALAAQANQTALLLFKLLADLLRSVLDGRYDEDRVKITSAQIREALATSAALARETKRELAGHLADLPDPDAIVRTLRRLWHTEVMLLRAVSSPLADAPVAVLRPAIEQLRSAVAALPACYSETARANGPPDLAQVERGLNALEEQLATMRQTGALRTLAMDDVIRLMTFDFALAQLRANIEDLGERSSDLASFAGATIPWMQSLRELAAVP